MARVQNITSGRLRDGSCEGALEGCERVMEEQLTLMNGDILTESREKMNPVGENEEYDS